jgi:hypothetical protein
MNGNYTGGTEMSTHGGQPPGPQDTPGGGAHGTGGHAHRMIDPDTGESPRRCTDLGCCICWLITMTAALTMIINSSLHGNTGRLNHGVDYYGRTCGADPGVENKPFLFWCREFVPIAGTSTYVAADNEGVPKNVDIDHPICVQACPTSNLQSYPCLLHVVNQTQMVPGGQFDNVETQIVQIRESKVLGKSYPTKARGGRYCIPKDETLRNQILEPWRRALGPMSPRRILVAIGTIQNVYWLFFCVFLLSLLMGYGYLYGIKFFPKYLVIFAVLIPMLWAFAMALGFSFFWLPLFPATADAGISEWYQKVNPLYKQWSVSAASWITLAFGLFFWFVFFFFLLLILKFEGHVISDIIHAVFDAFRTDGGMFLQPALEAVVKFIVFWFGIQGLKIIAAEGWIEKNNIEVNGARFAGLTRGYTPSVEDGRFYLLLIAWIIVWFWSMEICNAFGQFVTSFEVFKYYTIPLEGKKKKKHGPSALWEGIRYGFLYHWGSIVKGAATIWTTRVPRFIYWVTSTLFTPGNPRGTPDHSSCLDCMQSVMKYLCCIAFCAGDSCKESMKEKVESPESYNKDGFHDVVIRSNDWEPAVQKGHELLEHSHPIVKSLYQKLDQMTINVVGIITIASLNALMVWLFVNLLDAYKEPESSLYVADTMMVTFLAWVLSAYIAFSFMTLWDHTCDGLLYCYAWSRKWKRESVDKFIPESLRYIVGFDDMENDRYPYYGRAKNNMYLRSWLPMVGVDDKHKKQDPNKTGNMRSKLPPAPAPQDSYMSGFGTGFGAWGRQQQVVSQNFEEQPLLG